MALTKVAGLSSNIQKEKFCYVPPCRSPRTSRIILRRLRDAFPGCSPARAIRAPAGPSPSTGVDAPGTKGGVAKIRALSSARVFGPASPLLDRIHVALRFLPACQPRNVIGNGRDRCRVPSGTTKCPDRGNPIWTKWNACQLVHHSTLRRNIQAADVMVITATTAIGQMRSATSPNGISRRKTPRMTTSMWVRGLMEAKGCNHEGMF